MKHNTECFIIDPLLGEKLVSGLVIGGLVGLEKRLKELKKVLDML